MIKILEILTTPIYLNWNKWHVLVLVIALFMIMSDPAFSQPYFSLFDPYKDSTEPHGESERYFWINDSGCPSDIRDTFQTAAKMWSFYSEPRILEIENITSEKRARDNKEIIFCESEEWVDEDYSGAVASTNAWVNWEYNYVHEADIVISDNRVSVCVMLHELGHALGLSLSAKDDDGNLLGDHHPDDPTAVMYYRVGCHQNFLTNTDLVLVAEAYNAPANCTPYIQDDWSIYFPNISGWEVELVYDQGNNEWELLWFNKAKPHTWKCNLNWRYRSQSNDFYIATDLYQNGDVYRKSFILNGRTLKEF